MISILKREIRINMFTPQHKYTKRQTFIRKSTFQFVCFCLGINRNIYKNLKKTTL